MAVFCNVVTTLDQSDLKLLEDFVSSIAGPAQGSSDAIIRFHQLCDDFYKLAKYYIRANLERQEQPQCQDRSPSIVPRKRNASSMLGNGPPTAGAQEQPTESGTAFFSNPMLSDPGDNWLLSGSFEDWFMGEPQSTDLFGGDWPAFGSL